MRIGAAGIEQIAERACDGAVGAIAVLNGG
jgi:hypothetical protein